MQTDNDKKTDGLPATLYLSTHRGAIPLTRDGDAWLGVASTGRTAAAPWPTPVPVVTTPLD